MVTYNSCLFQKDQPKPAPTIQTAPVVSPQPQQQAAMSAAEFQVLIQEFRLLKVLLSDL